MNSLDQQALQQGIVDNPNDDLARTAYADWYEENGQAERAEFIRLQIRMEKLKNLMTLTPSQKKEFNTMKMHERELWRKNEKAWKLADIPAELADIPIGLPGTRKRAALLYRSGFPSEWRRSAHTEKNLRMSQQILQGENFPLIAVNLEGITMKEAQLIFRRKMMMQLHEIRLNEIADSDTAFTIQSNVEQILSYTDTYPTRVLELRNISMARLEKLIARMRSTLEEVVLYGHSAQINTIMQAGLPALKKIELNEPRHAVSTSEVMEMIATLPAVQKITLQGHRFNTQEITTLKIAIKDRKPKIKLQFRILGSNTM